MGGFPENPVLRTLVTAFRWTFKQAYLSAYFRRSPYNQKDLKLWLFPVIFARLSEGIEAERAKSIQWLKKLSKSLPQS
jgi:hypothetical protein